MVSDGDYQVAYDASSVHARGGVRRVGGRGRTLPPDRAAASSLDVTVDNPRWEEDVSLRLVMLHLIHEYARHNGHADFLREGIDGVTGA